MSQKALHQAKEAISEVEKPRMNNVSKAIMDIIRNHTEQGSDLEKELYKVLDIIEKEEDKASDIKSLAYELVAKLV